MKFKFVSVDADHYLWGTNDEEKAKKVAATSLVWNVETGEYLFGESEVKPENPEVMNLSEIPGHWLEESQAEKL
jgi:hypothetical protein